MQTLTRSGWVSTQFARFFLSLFQQKTATSNCKRDSFGSPLLHIGRSLAAWHTARSTLTSSGENIKIFS